jgi:hypothetical protein
VEHVTANIASLQAAINHAERSREWIVIVTPTSKNLAVELSRMLVTMLPSDATLSGRTAIFPNGGRLTVAAGSHQLHGDGFRVLFRGFEGELMPTDEIEMHSWSEAAQGTVTIGSQSGGIRVQ